MTKTTNSLIFNNSNIDKLIQDDTDDIIYYIIINDDDNDYDA